MAVTLGCDVDFGLVVDDAGFRPLVGTLARSVTAGVVQRCDDYGYSRSLVPREITKNMVIFKLNLVWVSSVFILE